MTVVCPINGTNPFSEPSKMKSYARRRKDYSKPLVIDCSVEYELPNSAKPPTGNKNEPLLMIHPSYYRREESKRRSHFINNLPKKQIATRFTRSALCRNSEKSVMNEGMNDCFVARRKINNNDRKSVVNDVQPLSRTQVLPSIFEAPSNFDNIAFQARKNSHCNKNIQSLQPSTNACTAPEVPQFDYTSVWRKAMQTNSQSQSSTDVNGAIWRKTMQTNSQSQSSSDVHEARWRKAMQTDPQAQSSTDPWRKAMQTDPQVQSSTDLWRKAMQTDPQAQSSSDLWRKTMQTVPQAQSSSDLWRKAMQTDPQAQSCTDLWRKAMQTDLQSQSSKDVHEVPDTSSMRVSELDDLTPVSVPVSPRAIDKWLPKLKTLSVDHDRVEDTIDPTYYNRSQDVIIKNHFGNNNGSITPHAQKAKRMKKSMTYSNTTAVGSATNSSSVTVNTGATIFQQQPAVGVAAIAATPTPLNCCSNCPMSTTVVDGDRHSLIRQQPWSATTAPEFPSSSLPMSHVAEKRSLNEIICPDVPPQLSSTRKRISDCNSWRCDECSSEDSPPFKRNRVAENENTEIYYPPNWPTGNPVELCARNTTTHRKQYTMDEMFATPRTGKSHFNSWRGNAYGNNDLSSSVKRNRVGTNENTQIYDASNSGVNHSEPCRGCKIKYSVEPHHPYNSNYSNGCAAAAENAANITSSNLWNRSGRSSDNLNMLHLFRL